MTTFDTLVILATLLGPILAVQAQKWVERYREARTRKLELFSVLMTTRALMTAADRVRALNMIDVVFRDHKNVVDKWREYHDSLAAVTAATEERFIDLLYEMSRTLGFSFDKVMLKRVVYIPQAHVDADQQQQDIQKNLRTMLIGQQEIQKGLLSYINGEKSLKIKIDNED